MIAATLLPAVADHWVIGALCVLSFSIWYVLVDRLFCFGWLLSRDRQTGKRRLAVRFEAGLARDGEDRQAVTLALSVQKWERELEKGFSVMKIATAAAPMLGLLGTVWGMLMTFETISHSGTGQPSLMADGISYALTTTMWGLMVAVPGMMAIPFLGRLKQRIVAEMRDLTLQHLRSLTWNG